MTEATKSRQGTRKRVRLGRCAFEKISAIEGITIDAELEGEFKEFDRTGMSAAYRRKAISRKCGKARP